MHCIACDRMLEYFQLRDRDEFCLVCNYIIDLLVLDLEEFHLEEMFGLYEDLEAREMEDEEE